MTSHSSDHTILLVGGLESDIDDLANASVIVCIVVPVFIACAVIELTPPELLEPMSTKSSPSGSGIPCAVKSSNDSKTMLEMTSRRCGATLDWEDDRDHTISSSSPSNDIAFDPFPHDNQEEDVEI